MKSYLFIQPHSDDVLFSAFHLLIQKSKKHNVKVLTVENSEKRCKEDKNLYEFLNLPWDHLNVEFEDNSYYGFYKKYKAVTNEITYEWETDYFGKEKLEEISAAVKKYIKDFQKENGDIVVLAPWGIGHPFHNFIRLEIDKAVKDMKHVEVIYYREFPHSYKKRSRFQIERQCENEELYKQIPIDNYEDEVKWALAKKFYKSQSGLLFYEQGYIRKNLPEEYYKVKK